ISDLAWEDVNLTTDKNGHYSNNNKHGDTTLYRGYKGPDSLSKESKKNLQQEGMLIKDKDLTALGVPQSLNDLSVIHEFLLELKDSVAKVPPSPVGKVQLVYEVPSKREEIRCWNLVYDY
ncbi:MAG: hypothetical protein ABEK59_13035, partial [Halobacteria archaeon]